MRNLLTALFLCFAILLGIAESASGASTVHGSKTASGDFWENPNICTYKLGSLELEPCRGDTIVGYDSATGVLYYVRQNPWTSFDPLGLQEKDSETAKKNLLKKINEYDRRARDYHSAITRWQNDTKTKLGSAKDEAERNKILTEYYAAMKDLTPGYTDAATKRSKAVEAYFAAYGGEFKQHVRGGRPNVLDLNPNRYDHGGFADSMPPLFSLNLQENILYITGHGDKTGMIDQRKSRSGPLLDGEQIAGIVKSHPFYPQAEGVQFCGCHGGASETGPASTSAPLIGRPTRGADTFVFGDRRSQISFKPFQSTGGGPFRTFKKNGQKFHQILPPQFMPNGVRKIFPHPRKPGNWIGFGTNTPRQ